MLAGVSPIEWLRHSGIKVVHEIKYPLIEFLDRFEAGPFQGLPH